MLPFVKLNSNQDCGIRVFTAFVIMTNCTIIREAGDHFARVYSFILLFIYYSLFAIDWKTGHKSQFDHCKSLHIF